MRIMTLNAWEGAQDTARYENIKTLTKEYGAEVVCLQEANHWHEGERSRLEDFAEDTKLTEVAFGNSNTDSKLAIYSKYPILGYVVHKDGFHHCAIQAWIEGDGGIVELINWHGHPFSEDERVGEVSRLVPHLGENAILTADTNSFSQEDENPESLWQTLMDLEIEKYGNLETGLRFDVMDRLMRHGFIDIAVKMKKNVPTFPAMKGLEPFQHPSRFDRMLARGKAAEAISHFQVITDPITELTSDHHPMLTDVDESVIALPSVTYLAKEPSKALHFTPLAA